MQNGAKKMQKEGLGPRKYQGEYSERDVKSYWKNAMKPNEYQAFEADGSSISTGGGLKRKRGAYEALAPRSRAQAMQMAVTLHLMPRVPAIALKVTLSVDLSCRVAQ